MNKLNGLDFQLTSSQGGWQWMVWVTGSWLHLSTHILTRRMTMDGLSDRKLVTSFNSPPHKEDDYICPNLHSHFLSFNSHPHKEDDSNSLAHSAISLIFQLTSSQGGWLIGDHQPRRSLAFQLTSSQGGWLTSPIATGFRTVFQLTSSQGGWLHSLPR